MRDQPDWRPAGGGDIALTDGHLSRIGYAAVTEAQAKMIAATMLKVLERLSHEQWVKLERTDFKSICKRLIAKSDGIDAVLEQRLAELEQVRATAHELRHIVVHAGWGEDPDTDRAPRAYDYGRTKRLGVADIEAAVEGCAALKSAAHSAAMRLGELILDGTFPSRRENTPGMSIRVGDQWARF